MTDKKRVAKHVQPSDFYWGVYMLGALLGIVLYYVSEGSLICLAGAIVLAIIGIFISHSRRIQESLDYE